MRQGLLGEAAQRFAHQPRPCEESTTRSGKQFSKNYDLDRPSRGVGCMGGLGRDSWHETDEQHSGISHLYRLIRRLNLFSIEITQPDRCSIRCTRFEYIFLGKTRRLKDIDNRTDIIDAGWPTVDPPSIICFWRIQQ